MENERPWERVRASGISDFGVPSERKGIATYTLSLNTTISVVTVFLREGWSNGYVYFFMGCGSDFVDVGTALGLPINSLDFGTLHTPNISCQKTTDFQRLLDGEKGERLCKSSYILQTYGTVPHGNLSPPYRLSQGKIKTKSSDCSNFLYLLDSIALECL